MDCQMCQDFLQFILQLIQLVVTFGICGRSLHQACQLTWYVIRTIKYRRPPPPTSSPPYQPSPPILPIHIGSQNSVSAPPN